MERKNEVLCKVFEILKDEEAVAKVTAVGKLEDGYADLKEKLENVTEAEYKQAIQTIRENKGKVEILSDQEMELTEAELESVSGGICTLHEVEIAY